MKNTLFDCSSCSSFCCIVPPMLYDENELIKAIGFGVRVIATKMDNGYYCSVVKNKKGVCPFVSSDRGCRIYGNNFKACKDFNCKGKTKTKYEMLGFKPIEFFDALSLPLIPLEKPNMFSVEVVEKYGIEIVSREEAVELVNVSSYEQMGWHLLKIYDTLTSP